MGVGDTVKFITRNAKADGAAIVPGEIAHYLNMPGAIQMNNDIWISPEKLSAALQNPGVSVFTYNVCFNQVNQIKMILKSGTINKILHERYSYALIGNNHIWISNDEANTMNTWRSSWDAAGKRLALSYR